MCCTSSCSLCIYIYIYVCVCVQFADGVYLVLLMGLLEDYFVPLYNFFLTPENFEQKVHNVQFAFELMQDGGLKKPKARPEGILLNITQVQYQIIKPGDFLKARKIL